MMTAGIRAASTSFQGELQEVAGPEQARPGQSVRAGLGVKQDREGGYTGGIADQALRLRGGTSQAVAREAE